MFRFKVTDAEVTINLPVPGQPKYLTQQLCYITIDKANEILDEHLKTLRRVYSDETDVVDKRRYKEPDEMWVTNKFDNATHTALLFNAEEIRK